MTFADDPGVVREFAVRHAESAGLPVLRVADLMLAVGELAANTARHSPGGDTVSGWCTADEALIQIQDRGRLLAALPGRGAWHGGRPLVVSTARSGRAAPSGTGTR